MDLWHEDRLLIDGELVAAEGGATYPSINPATGEEVASAADASLADTERAIGQHIGFREIGIVVRDIGEIGDHRPIL